jgi:hypothetical protein
MSEERRRLRLKTWFAPGPADHAGRAPAPGDVSDDALRSPVRSRKKLHLGFVLGFVGALGFAALGYAIYRNLAAGAEVAATAGGVPAAAAPAAAAVAATGTASRPLEPVASPATVPPPAIQAAPAEPAAATAAAAPPPPPRAAPRAPVAAAKSSAVEPSTDFLQWVAQLSIVAIRSGSSPRILIDGTSFAPGALVNAELGVWFDGYDASRRILRFKDRSGAVVERGER